MELLFDVGNTHTVVGYCNNNDFKIWRIGTKNIESEDELFSKLYNIFKFNKINMEKIKDVGISSVVPSKNFIFQNFVRKYFNTELCFVSTKNKVLNIQYLVDYPNEVGADRVSNIIASKKEYGNDVIAIDFGTAITIDVLKDGNFIGGSIIPGFKTSMLALFSNTAKLPQVELKVPKYSIGKSTIDNIQIGVLKTTLFGIEKIIEEIKKETNTEYKIVTTGGMGKSLKDFSNSFKNYDSNLTLKGILYYIKELKRGEK